MFPGHKGSSTHEDTVIVIKYVRPLHDKPDNIPAQRMEIVINSQPQLTSYWKLIADRRVKVNFL